MATSNPKNIIICCDGTGNEYGVNKTNVVRTCEIATNDDSQLVYYDPGVGTGGLEYEESKQDIIDKATGDGLQKNVEDAYRYLMKVYEPNDKVYLFGFSRGAFTARSLAGMLSHCGLLRFGLDNLVEYASKLYNHDDDMVTGFKEDFCRPCPVHFIGVWDTVESLAGDASDKFHDYRLNPEIKYAYHAVAIDEMRKKFPPCMWDETNISKGQTMEQVWFAGVHSDVGGWYPERGLSDIALRWMLEKAKPCGMKLDQKKFDEVKGDFAGKQHKSYTGFWKAMGTHKRQVPPGGKVHKSVEERMEKTGYKPVKPLPDDVVWVD